MTLDEQIKILENNAEYIRKEGDLQGCLNFRQLVEWLKDYKRLLEQEPCEDAISRQAVEEIINDIRDCISVEGYWAILERMKKLPPVNLQEPKHCDRNICTKNEYNGISCDECEVTKSQEPCSEHKNNDAYSKGFEDGKKQAFTGYCMQCYDELSPYEQAKLMVEWGADIPPHIEPDNCGNYVVMQPTAESVEDAISRKAVLNTLNFCDKALDVDRTVERYKSLLTECYKVLPSVQPITKENLAIPLSAIEDIRDEVYQMTLPSTHIFKGNTWESIRYGVNLALEIIDKHIADMIDTESEG